MNDGSDKEQGGKLTLQSSRFGEVTVSADEVIEIPTGLLGFPESKRFVVLEHAQPFYWLHSVDDECLAFVVMDGSEFGDAYQVPKPLGDTELDFQDDDEMAVLVLVTVHSDPSQTTANLKAPLAINLRNRKGAQLVLEDTSYSTQHPLRDRELKK